MGNYEEDREARIRANLKQKENDLALLQNQIIQLRKEIRRLDRAKIKNKGDTDGR